VVSARVVIEKSVQAIGDRRRPLQPFTSRGLVQETVFRGNLGQIFPLNIDVKPGW
jgi:hypothetical protein